MITIKCRNGVELEYDETLKQGDLITTYFKGYFSFVKFTNRGNHTTPLASFVRFADTNGKLYKTKKVYVCDASYCRNATIQVKAEIEKNRKTIAALEKLIQLDV